MNGHDANGRSLLPRELGRAVIRVVFFQIVDITHKIAESAVADALKLLRLHDKHLQIGIAKLSARARRLLSLITALLVECPQKLRELQIALLFPPGGEFRKQRRRFFCGLALIVL